VADGVWMSYIKDVKQKVCYNIMLYVSPLLKSDEVIGNYIEPLMSVRKRQNQSDKVFYTVVYSQYEGYTLRPNPIKKVIVDKSTNYNDTFGSVSEIIEKSISERKTGIILLYGEPGTGKTHYLRYIISKFNKKRNFIYIPPALFDHLSNPEFVSFLSSNTGSVLIIEDAKELIRKDVHGIRAQGVNNLLNMSDGLLNDYLDIQIIITSNMGTDEVEPALLREGRLICEYEFTKLDKEKANQLAKNINRDVVFDEDVALSKVYNIDPKRIKKEVGGKIGFGR
jgi:SpoVK/Ycf46/Vps4 family AAA+-type ATPase